MASPGLKSITMDRETGRTEFNHPLLSRQPLGADTARAAYLRHLRGEEEPGA